MTAVFVDNIRDNSKSTHMFLMENSRKISEPFCVPFNSSLNDIFEEKPFLCAEFEIYVTHVRTDVT